MKGMHGNERLSCQCVVENDGEIEIEFESWHHQQENEEDEEGDTVFI